MEPPFFMKMANLLIFCFFQTINVQEDQKSNVKDINLLFFLVKADMLLFSILMSGGHQGGHPDLYLTSKYNLELIFSMIFTEFETLLQNEINELSYSIECPPLVNLKKSKLFCNINDQMKHSMIAKENIFTSVTLRP